MHPDDAARSLLRPKGAVGEAARSVVLALARSDPRLEIDGEGLLVLSALPRADLPLESTEFVVSAMSVSGSRSSISINLARSARSSGSPPVKRILRTPSVWKTRANR